MQDKIQILLEKPIEVHRNGQAETAFSLEIKAPTNRLLNQVAEIEKAFMSAAMKLSEKTSAAETKDSAQTADKSPESNVLAIMAAGVDIRPCYAALREILLESATIDGIKFTDFHYSNMTPADTKKILGEYIANFTQFSQKG